jgi:hypothetical protein
MLKEPGRHDQGAKLAPSFEEFKRAVLENLQSPLFAESSSSKPSQLSPAVKELKRKEAYPCSFPDIELLVCQLPRLRFAGGLELRCQKQPCVYLRIVIAMAFQKLFYGRQHPFEARKPAVVL